VWTAFLAYLLLGKRLSSGQCVGILVICVGLTIRSVVIEFKSGPEELIGATCLFIAAILHGLSYVYNEKYLTGPNAIEGPNLVCMIGIVNSIVLTLWQLVWTIPRWNTLVVQNIRDRNGDPVVIIVCYLVLSSLCLIRSATLWYIIKHLGAVSSGVLKGTRTAITFVGSHFLFCHLQPSQCLTTTKGFSAAVCVAGVMTYSLSGRGKRLHNQRTESDLSTADSPRGSDKDKERGSETQALAKVEEGTTTVANTSTTTTTQRRHERAR